MTKSNWFDVDKAGLAKLLEKKGKAFALFELVQNCWDTNATEVKVTLTPIEGRPYAELVVEDDDPEGFKNLDHTFTLFAESEKKGDPTKRGRFNLGEKLVLALCEEAAIVSTKGTVRFTKDGRETNRSHLAKGSLFRGRIRMTRAELEDVERQVRTLIPPMTTLFNGEQLPERPLLGFKGVSLPTEVADAEGYLRKTTRMTEVTAHEVLEGETPTLYEMGIPVVELTGGEKWHVNVHQKVPLSVDRDNVTPAFLQLVRLALAEMMKDRLTKDDVSQVWVSAASEDSRIGRDVVEKVLDEKFGKKRAIFDPSDPEANKALMDQGFTVIHGGSLSSGQWANVRAGNLAQPSGKIKPSPVQYSEEGRPERVIDPAQYTLGQRSLVEYTVDLAKRLLGTTVTVMITSEATMPYSGSFGRHDMTLRFNMGRLGKAWFENGIGDFHHRLIIHEFAHAKVSDHLTREFSDEVCRLAVKLAREMYVDPNFFKYAGYNPDLR